MCLYVCVNFTVMHKMEAGSVREQIAWANVPQRTVELNFPTPIRLTRRIGGVSELSSIIFWVFFFYSLKEYLQKKGVNYL